MNQQRKSSTFAEIVTLAQRLLAGFVVALVMAFAPAQLAAQDQQPLAIEAPSGVVITAPATASEAPRDLRRGTLPPEIQRLSKPTTQLIIVCGPAGCFVCSGLRCVYYPG